jgi:glucans biosynthesis protein
MKRPHRHLASLRWLPLIAMTGLVLSACASPQAIENLSQTSRTALTQSHQALRLSRAVQAQARAASKRLNMITEDQALLKQQMEAMNKRLSPGKGEPAQTEPATPGFLQHLVMRAKAAAHQPYKAPPKIPSSLKALDYDQYAKIRFHGKVPGWSAMARFQPEVYPAGYLFRHAVRIYLLKSGQEEPLQFPISDFSFGPEIHKFLSGQTPLAGFSLYYPFGDTGTNEFLSFKGASYFRAIGSGQTWGLSARGVAINTAVSHMAEEFPYYHAFWIVPPTPGAQSLTLYARLDSPSLTGACRFIIHPGAQTVMDVKMVLFARKSVKRLGIAPLTSMFLQGGGRKRFDPLLRAVHDSDGLSIEADDGQWQWYPLRNPKHLVLRELPFNGIKGFGLMQRSRQYDDYLSYGINYQKRPSAWITPTGGDWGKGHMALVELPTDNETNDNITTFWVPETEVGPGKSITFSYRIAWQGDTQTLPPLAHVSATRHGRKAGTEIYIIHFRGGDLDALPPWVKLQPRIQLDGPASLASAWVVKDPGSGHWRLEMAVKRTDAGPVRLRATLNYHARVLTETWDDQLPGK